MSGLSNEELAQSIYAICGDPVHQVKLPEIFNNAFTAHSVNAKFIPLQLEESGIASLFELFKYSDNFKGIVVTMPYKAIAAQNVERLSKRSNKLGLVNVVYKRDGQLIGDMTDGVGMYDAIKHKFNEVDAVISGLSLGIVGFGAAAKTILFQLIDVGLNQVVILDDGSRRSEAETLKAFLNSLNRGIDVYIDEHYSSCDLLLNASPLGMSAIDECPFTDSQLSQARLVADVVGSENSKLQKNCHAKSIDYVNGSDMARAQSPQIAELFAMPNIFNPI